ncbi:helix-turn-helix domain-containing protein [Flavobacterium phycosphaerae]|uniref:helix-turn-helix domain-containing protein n=1 Tax=Flavobacterium phycosphaerae TaxID=2697515 RepID=UPI00138A11B9|nr:helix-turn-helix domain-containing protein [Flavobacterium phycosphaerae]
MEDFTQGLRIEDHYYDNADMKRIFKVCDKTLSRWRHKDIVPFLKFGGKFFYPKTVIEALVKERMRYLKFRSWNWDGFKGDK